MLRILFRRWEYIEGAGLEIQVVLFDSCGG